MDVRRLTASGLSIAVEDAAVVDGYGSSAGDGVDTVTIAYDDDTDDDAYDDDPATHALSSLL